MENATNLNNSGFGAASNWNGPTTGQNGGAQTTGTPTTIPNAQQQANVSTGNIIDDNMLWNDILSTAQNFENKTTAENSPLPYVTYSDLPYLTKSTITDPSFANNTLNQLLNPPSDKLQEFLQSFSSATSNFASSIGINPEEIAQFAKTVVTDPEIINLAKESGLPAGVVQNNIQIQQQNAFSEIVSQLPPEIANRLTFAQYVPGGAKNLPPQLQAQLSMINQQVQQTVSNNLGFSSNWIPLSPDPKNFLNQLGIETSHAFDQEVEARVNNGTLTAAEAKTLTAMENGLAVGTPTLKNLLKIIQQQITTKLQAKYGFEPSYQPQPEVSYYNNVVNGEFAINYQKNVAKYTGAATAEQKALLKQYAANPNDPSIPASIKQLAQQISADQQLLLQVFPDPENSSLSGGLKDVADQLMEVSKDSVIESRGLDATWQPTTSALQPLDGTDKSNDIGFNAIAVGKEVVAQGTSIASAMPNSPEKGTFLDFLKIIGTALNNLEDSMYAMQASQSNISKEMGAAKLTTQLDNLAKQQQSIKQTEDKEKKMASMGPLGKIFEWILKIVMVVLSVVGGPAAMAMAIFYFADSANSEAHGNAPTLVDKMFSAISNSMSPGAASATSFLLASFISFVSANPLLAMNLIGTDSKFMQLAIQSAGGNSDAQQMGAMIFNITVQVAAIILITIFTLGSGTAGAVGSAAADALEDTSTIVTEELPEIIGESTGELAEDPLELTLEENPGDVAKAAENLEIDPEQAPFEENIGEQEPVPTSEEPGNDPLSKSLSDYSKYIKIATTIVSDALQLTQGAINLNNNILLAQVDMIQGRAKAYNEKVQALVALLQQLVTELLNLIQGGVNNIATINTFQGKKWDNASQILSQIAG